MEDLIAFLNARLDEDERVALAAEATQTPPWLTIFETALTADDVPEEVRRAIARHIARFTPGRMLWDIAAKRRLLDLHKRGEYGECVTCDVGAQSCGCCGWGDFPCDTVRLLALPYADRDGYRKEWRP